jgi:hypothetical protein
MRPLALVPLWAFLLIGCQGVHNDGDRGPRAKDKQEAHGQYTQITINLDRSSPNVDVSSYVLVTDDVEAERGEAEAIMRLRAKLPLAVMTKDAALFDRILARGFFPRGR